MGPRPVTLHLSQEVLRLALRDPFRIARSDHGAGHAVTTVIVEVRDDRFPGLVGVGEGYPDRYYGETPGDDGDRPADARRGGRRLASRREPGWPPPAAAMDGVIRGHGAAKCALDIALHDLAGKVAGVPVHELLGLSADLPPTDFTIGIDTPEVVAQRARRAAHSRRSRSRWADRATWRPSRPSAAVYGGPIRVDANTGWTLDGALAILPDLERLGVELIEQPFPARRLDLLRQLQERSALPIVADESCVLPEDLDGLVGVVAGVNVKLAKCGGIGPARAMLERARGARLPDVPRLHGGDVGRDRRLGGRRVAGRLGRPGRLPAAGRRPVRGARAGRRASLDSRLRGQVSACRAGPPEPVHARTARAFAERPFVWTTWWTKSWTSPLPGRAPAVLGWPLTGRPTPREGVAGIRETAAGRRARIRPSRPSGFMLASAVDRSRVRSRPWSEGRARHRWTHAT